MDPLRVPANMSPLKRSFAAAIKSSPSPTSNHNFEVSLVEVHGHTAKIHLTSRLSATSPRHLAPEKRYPIMSAPSNTQRTHVSIPPFMSVFGDHTSMTGIVSNGSVGPQQTISKQYPTGSLPAHNMSPVDHYSLQYHRGSTSTSNSAYDSTDSSPTTTISTVDSASITEPSPSSSPESPGSAYPPKMAGRKLSEDLSLSPPLSPLPRYNQPLSPGRKPRNTKNLSLNMAVPTRQAPRPPLRVRTAAILGTAVPQSAPSSPSFIVPPQPPKRRPSALGLTIQTPGSSLSDASPSGLRIIPPPAGPLSNKLRHHASSPSLSVLSPTTGMAGGMQLPPTHAQTFHLPRQTPTLSHRASMDSIPRSEHLSPNGQALDGLEEEVEDYGDETEEPLSQEAKKSPAYPEGPVCIYDPHVFLFLEPNSEECCQFGVVFNVAREVKKPFDAEVNVVKETAVEAKDTTAKIDENTELQPADSISSIQAASEGLPTARPASPTTPKASLSAAPKPEYIHIPWDHNTNIVDDLLNLVEVIDERVRQGKRVLIHCQCGVSRSASLIIAYGLYRDPTLTVQQAYDAVKKRSRWIGPNMSLIYQLTEFRTKLHKKLNAAQPSYHARSWGRPKMGPSGMSTSRSVTLPNGQVFTRGSLSDVGLERFRNKTSTMPLLDERDREREPASAYPSSPDGPPAILGLDTRLSRAPTRDTMSASMPSSAFSWLGDVPSVGGRRKVDEKLVGNARTLDNSEAPLSPLETAFRIPLPSPRSRSQPPQSPSQPPTQDTPLPEPARQEQDQEPQKTATFIGQASVPLALRTQPSFASFSSEARDTISPLDTSGLMSPVRTEFSMGFPPMGAAPIRHRAVRPSVDFGYIGVNPPVLADAADDPRSPVSNDQECKGPGGIVRNIFDVL